MESTAIDNLFAAVEIAGIETNVSTLLIGFIGINLLFLGGIYVKKAMGFGKR